MENIYLGQDLHIFQQAAEAVNTRVHAPIMNSAEMPANNSSNTRTTQKKKGRPIKMSLEDFTGKYRSEEMQNVFDSIPVKSTIFCKKYGISRRKYFYLLKRMKNHKA